MRKALAQVLPNAAHLRRIRSITYGPGPLTQCNVALKLRPQPNAAEPIMEIVESLNPAGKTPLVQAVEKAAEVLDFRTKPGTVIVLTDGEETCGGAPCHLGKMLAAEGAQHSVNLQKAGANRSSIVASSANHCWRDNSVNQKRNTSSAQPVRAVGALNVEFMVLISGTMLQKPQ